MFDRFPHQVPRHELFGGPNALHVVFTIVFLALMAGLVVWLVLNARHHHVHPSTPPQIAAPGMDPAVREARMRYARGELTREQFKEIATDLGDDQPPPTP